MVGWSRRARESSERAARAAARAKACIDAGCKCYCHAPRPKSDSGLFAVVVFTIFGICWIAFWALLADISKNSPPPEPYVCNSITSTGAPADCHPAVLPPDVLKQYEQHFKQ